MSLLRNQMDYIEALQKRDEEACKKLTEQADRICELLDRNTELELELKQQVQRLEYGLRDIHDRLTGKCGKRKWVVGHIENLLAGRRYCEWESKLKETEK